MSEKNIWTLSEKSFGPLWPYIQNDEITDIDWDSHSLWVKYINGNVEQINIDLTDEDIFNFASLVANQESKSFNGTNTILSAETDKLRITIVHNAFATTGICFSIRKSLPNLRFTAKEALDSKYCEPETLAFLINSVAAKMNFAFCGEPGHGKTECAKFCSSFIPSKDKVVTIEDVLEWHYDHINPTGRGIAFKVNSHEEYSDAIKIALRLNPTWVMLSEARSREVKFLLETWSTGIRGMTTLHTNDVRNIPDRIINMAGDRSEAERMANNVHMYLNIGVFLEETVNEDDEKYRRIKQVCCYYRENEENKQHMLVDNGKLISKDIPNHLLKVFRKYGIDNPFDMTRLNERMKKDSFVKEDTIYE